jgi:hypothetical protein
MKTLLYFYLLGVVIAFITIVFSAKKVNRNVRPNYDVLTTVLQVVFSLLSWFMIGGILLGKLITNKS